MFRKYQKSKSSSCGRPARIKNQEVVFAGDPQEQICQKVIRRRPASLKATDFFTLNFNGFYVVKMTIFASHKKSIKDE